MKKLLSVLLLFGFFLSGYGQKDAGIIMRKIGDSILLVVEKEKDDDARFDDILRLVNSGADSDPLYTLDLAGRLYKIAQKNNDRVSEASAWSYYGQGHRLTGNFTKALECHYKAIEVALKTGNNSLIGQCYNQLAHIYKDREENEKAIQIYQTARGYSLIGHSTAARMWPVMNLGAVYLNANKLDSSVYFSKQAYNSALNLPGNMKLNYMPYILGNLARSYSKMKKNDEAMHYFDSALQIVKTPLYNNIRQKQILFVGIAEHFKKNGQLDSSLYYAKQAVALVNNTVFAYLNVKPAKMLSEAYENINADSTVKYLKLFLTTNDMINSTRVTQQLQMMTFDNNQRNLEIQQARKDARVRFQIYMLIAVLLLVTVFGAMMYRNSKQKQKVNQQLHKQKLEIENTLEKLKLTQAQLVQSEKMASLGELTAGIAHEIQNPLNFVNNFSEVNKELIVDLKNELANGDIPEASLIVEDIAANSEKINHHGKRADAIVKGMLQHSRSSAGIKEPTDINALCDEYLRLSYHGLRAKDKSFNADFKTDFASNLPKPNAIPQEIGRVLLNLFNNAFYAVNEKKKSNPDFSPSIEVRTQRENEYVCISVKDNGSGIPEKILNKIWQPFFTTKPTGEGTGLGLSLSYDIITKGHSGEMRAETKEGEGTTFIIKLPVTS